jgi:iron uptake system component EfeO
VKRLLLVCLLVACGGGGGDGEAQQKIVDDMHATLLAEIRALKAACVELKARAPAKVWMRSDIDAMKQSWGKARTAYERIEGAVAPLFPDIDAAIDERYDGFLEGLGPTGDQNLFDGTGVTGMHAVERILWSDSIPPGVVQIESALAGYKAAAFPANDAEAVAFRDQLATQLVADVQLLEDQWGPAKIDLAGAYQGLVDLMREQREKVNNAADNLEESRYAQVTMRDLRDNLAGTKTIYALFQPWLKSKTGGSELDGRISSGFDAVAAAYAGVSSDAIPAPPSTWSAEMPSAADLQTPFGQLYTKVRAATDPTAEASVVKQLQDAGKVMGFAAP